MSLIGVFDSGVGGLSVANAISKALPQHQVLLREDKQNVPYGTKTVEQIHGFVLPILQGMVRDGCDVIVIACNTVTTTLIARLREQISVPLVGLEPMIKPAAALTKSGVIAVCATPTTLSSKRYAWLKATYAKGVTVVEPDCSDWSSMIESNSIDQKHIAERMQHATQAGADVIVLGCTHYHWIEESIQRTVEGKAVVLQPEQPVINQLKRVLARLA